MSHSELSIFVNRRRVEAPNGALTGLQVLELAEYGPDYELYELQGEGDPTGGQLVGHDQSIALKNGLHFRALPGNANFG